MISAELERAPETVADEMETAFAKEFGALDFSLTASVVPFGIGLDENYKKVWEGHQYLLTGRLVLPDGTHAEAIARLELEHEKQEAFNAMTAITKAVLRRLARFYHKEQEETA